MSTASKTVSTLQITAKTSKGGAVSFNPKQGVWASYATATVANRPAPEIFYAGAKLKDGRRVQFFLNRETGLIVVDVIDKDEKGGTEILRRTMTP